MTELTGAGRDHLPLFMTTEHFTLQTARASAMAELNARTLLFLTTLSSSIVALALAAQVSGVHGAFLGFALVLLPTEYALGLMTLGRLRQVQGEARVYAQGMNRIRHYYVETAPEMQPYLVLPSTDDPWVTLHAVGMTGSGWSAGLLTRSAVVVLVNSVVAGVVAGLLAHAADAPPAVIGSVGAAFGVASLVVLGLREIRAFARDIASHPTAFPADGPDAPPLEVRR